MKNTLFISSMIFLLFSCHNSSEETITENEIIPQEIPEEIPNNIEEEIIEETEEEIVLPPTPDGKLLYSMEQLFIYENKAKLNGQILYDGAAELALLIEHEETEDCPVHYDFNYNPLSLIGNYYSYELLEFGDYGCGPPSNSNSIKSIDISTKSTIKITDLFTEKSIIAALKKDGWVINNTKEYDIDLNRITTFSEFLKAFGDSDFSRFDENSFAILNYDKEKDLAAVRLIGTSYMGFNHSEYIQLGMWIKPKGEMSKLLKEKAFFYLGEFKNGVKK